MPPIPDESDPLSYHNLSSPSDSFGPRNPPSATAHSRETSTVRGRAADPPVLASSTLQPQLTRRATSHSKSPEASTRRPGAGYDVGLERKPSNSYGHHRQTSIVHGVQHSRNTSHAAPPNPLSPELIASMGRNGPSDSDYAGLDMFAPGTSGSNHASPNALGTLDGSGKENVSTGSPANPLHRRMNSTGKPRLERSHSRSQSKPSESKTVGEYALHHLFNSFVGQADGKINQAIMKLGEPDAPVEQVCGPGSDPNFDQLISALGHIARQKPKPLIDTIMFWRKAKGDAAITAKQVIPHISPTSCSITNCTAKAIAIRTWIDTSEHRAHSDSWRLECSR